MPSSMKDNVWKANMETKKQNFRVLRTKRNTFIFSNNFIK